MPNEIQIDEFMVVCREGIPEEKAREVVACYRAMVVRAKRSAYCSDIANMVGLDHAIFKKDNAPGSKYKRVARAFKYPVQVGPHWLSIHDVRDKRSNRTKMVVMTHGPLPSRSALVVPDDNPYFQPATHLDVAEHPRATADLALIRRIDALEARLATLEAREPASAAPDNKDHLIDTLWAIGLVERSLDQPRPSKAAAYATAAATGEDE